MFNLTPSDRSRRPWARVLLTAAAAFCGAHAGAAPEDAAHVGCRAAFLSSLSKSGPAAAEMRVTFMTEGYAATDAQFAAGEYSYDLAARDAKTGLPVATATCVVNEAGVVTGILNKKTVRAPTVAAR